MAQGQTSAPEATKSAARRADFLRVAMRLFLQKGGAHGESLTIIELSKQGETAALGCMRGAPSSPPSSSALNAAYSASKRHMLTHLGPPSSELGHA